MAHRIEELDAQALVLVLHAFVCITGTSDEMVAALLRALDFFGAMRQADGRLLVPHGVGADAPQQLVDAESVPLAQLHHAAARCIAEMEPGRAPASLG